MVNTIVKEIRNDQHGQLVFVSAMKVFVAEKTNGQFITIGVCDDGVLLYAEDAEHNDNIKRFFVKDGATALTQAAYGVDYFEKWICPQV